MRSLDYFKRAAVMLLVVMPLVALGLTLFELRDSAARAEGVLNVFGGAVLMVYFWGALSGLAVSLAHTALIRAFSLGLLPALGLAVVLGVCAGALTPTLFTGLLHPPTILGGGLAGLMYGVISGYPAPSPKQA